MKDPLINPTPWLKSKMKQPKTSRYYFSHKRFELKMIRDWHKIRHQFI